jgi:hypothetical protein
LTEQIIIDQRTAIRGSDQVGSSSRGQANLNRSAAHCLSNIDDCLILSDLTFLQFGDPNLIHSFRLEQADILFIQDVAFRQKLPSAGPKNGTAEDSAGGCLNV